MPEKSPEKSPEKTLSIAAIAISLVAVALTGYQSWLSYQHNRVSLMPKLDWRFEYNRSNDFVFQIRLINAGLGPAIISQASILIDGRSLGGLNAASCSAIDEWVGLTGIEHIGNSCWSMEQGEEIYMNPSEELILYQIGPHNSGEDRWVSTSQVQRIGVLAEYCSFYGDCQTLE